jgi:hypothetical protein
MDARVEITTSQFSKRVILDPGFTMHTPGSDLRNDISGLSVLGGDVRKLPAPGLANSFEIIGFKRLLDKWRKGLGENS